jgi:type IV conjugative transfer system coupling protein TraD
MTEKNDIKHFTRGGQITLHNLRMFTQIMDKVAIAACLVAVLVMVSVFWKQTSEYERYVYGEYVWSLSWPLVDKEASTDFIQPDGRKVKVVYKNISHAELVQKIVKKVNRKIIFSLLFGLISGMVTLGLISRWLRKRGEKQTENILLKGDNILPAALTRKIIVNNKQASTLSLAKLPLIKHTETAHLLFHGTTGSGKSNAIKELLDQIRAKGDRAIIYDKSCNFLEEFYQPNTDILLNPLDERGQAWDLWQECRDSADFDSLAAAQIPMPLSSQDPFWVNAARTIFSAAAFEMRKDKDKSVMKLLQTLLTADLVSIQKYLKGTEAETLVSDKIEKTAVSIKSVLATYLKSLKYVREDDHSFSIRKWIQDNQAKNWLFITSLGDKHETLKPLITAWLDIAVNSLLSLTASEDRRIWLILDELASLQQLPYLTQTLSESRKFGGCVVVGIQNYAQLTKLYGHDGGREISALLNTRFMFRQPDPDMAKWAANNFGESFIDEVREGTSYGANTIRDGISINRVETRKQVVSYSEVMSLSNLYAYVRLPGKFPITLVDFVFKKRQRRNIGFLSRDDFDDNNMKKMDNLIDTCTALPVGGIGKATKFSKKKSKESVIVDQEQLIDV